MEITKTNKFVAGAVVGAGLLVGSLGLATMDLGVANAATPTTSAPTTAPAANHERHPGLRRLRHHEFKVAADTIGVKPAELRADLKAGQSVADVATAKGVAVDTVVNAVVKDASAKIDQAVTNGKLTQAQADAAKAKLPAQVTKLVNARHTAK